VSNIHIPQRLSGEDFESYKQRRRDSQAAIKEYIDNPPKSNIRWHKVMVGPWQFKMISLNRLDKKSARYQAR
jgi:hypothetical protein